MVNIIMCAKRVGKELYIQNIRFHIQENEVRYKNQLY